MLSTRVSWSVILLNNIMWCSFLSDFSKKAHEETSILVRVV